MKAFITSDLETLYERAVYKKVPGKSPEAAFLNEAGEEVEEGVLDEGAEFEVVELVDGVKASAGGFEREFVTSSVIFGIDV